MIAVPWFKFPWTTQTADLAHDLVTRARSGDVAAQGQLDEVKAWADEGDPLAVRAWRHFAAVIKLVVLGQPPPSVILQLRGVQVRGVRVGAVKIADPASCVGRYYRITEKDPHAAGRILQIIKHYVYSTPGGLAWPSFQVKVIKLGKDDKGALKVGDTHISPSVDSLAESLDSGAVEWTDKHGRPVAPPAYAVGRRHGGRRGGGWGYPGGWWGPWGWGPFDVVEYEYDDEPPPKKRDAKVGFNGGFPGAVPTLPWGYQSIWNYGFDPFVFEELQANLDSEVGQNPAGIRLMYNYPPAWPSAVGEPLPGEIEYEYEVGQFGAFPGGVPLLPFGAGPFSFGGPQGEYLRGGPGMSEDIELEDRYIG